MSNFINIQNKLRAFVKRFYTNELIKGAILFFTIGVLYFMVTVFIESVLWLNTLTRTVLFWLVVLVEILLLAKFIVLPLAKLFNLRKGINYEDASKIIGKHFPEVNDKLLNVLQLKQSESRSELLLASIEQKSLELEPIPFKRAINFKKNIGYLKYAAIPVVILLCFAITGNFNIFNDGYERITHYHTAYEPPAPFQFVVNNNSLQGIENENYRLVVKTVGDVTPESVEIKYNNETYVLQEKAVGEFEYVFDNLSNDVTFRLYANEVASKPYDLDVIKAPSMLGFEMFLSYPEHTKRKSEVMKGSGNALVPEGTDVKWVVRTKTTDVVKIYGKDTINFSGDKNGVFKASKSVFNGYAYDVATSNKALLNYEKLSFRIDVVKDQYPELEVNMKVDSLDLQSLYFYGQVSDDYGFSKLQLVYYPVENVGDKRTKKLKLSGTHISEFVEAFPNDLNIEEGISYDMYFEIFDNDAINKYKSVKSKVFSYRKRTKEEEEKKQLVEQKETIEDMNKSLEKFGKENKELESLTKTQKEKSRLNFNDKKKLQAFFKRQKQQDEVVKNFNKKLKKNLEEFQKNNENKKDDEFKKDLEKRLKENEEQLKKDEKLLKELEKLADKISKEKLGDKLEKLAKQNKNKKRSLQQLLELTKRFYVEKKLEKLKDNLENLSEEQEKLSEESDEKNTKEKQAELNKSFEDYKKDIEELEKESKGLRKPIDIPRDKVDEKEIDKEQKEALENLEDKEPKESDEEKKDSKSKAKKNQKKAAQKMKEMSEKMGASMSGGGGDQMKEDTDMLRQVLDNLVLFSFDQERLMEKFGAIEVNHNKYASYLRNQQNLKSHFEHIDDSLFALSLRQPKLSETVNKEISEVYFNMDRAMELLAENQLYQGKSKQQYAVTAANNLSNFLSDVLDNMEESMSMSKGQGEGDEQLPDIIKSQEELNKMMEEGMKKGEKGKPKEEGGDKKGDKSGDGKKGEGSEEGKEKGKGKSGKEGEGNEVGSGDKGDGKGKGKGKGENDKLGSDPSGEEDSEELYKIYQRQQELRQALQEQLSKEGLGKEGKALVRKMEEVELDLLNKGLTNRTLQKMMDLKHQLMKLENATLQQGEDNKRKSESNKEVFKNNSKDQIPTAKQYFKTNEILNRQALPLRPIYKKKVQTYFKQNND